MADAMQIVPPLPDRGEIVSTGALYNTQMANYRTSLAFGGTRSPSMIWTEMIRNSANAMLYFREIEEKDDDVANALDTLKENVLEPDWSIQPFDDTPLAAEIAAFVTAQIAQVPNFDGALDNMLDAIGYGFSVQEMLFDTSAGQASLLDIKDCPQELFLFGNRFQPQIGTLQFLTNPFASEGAEVPEDKFLIYSYRPRSRDRMGRPLIRSVFWASWFKRNIQRLWMRYAEKGPGTAVTRYNDSDSDAEKQKAADIAEAIVNEPALAIPRGMEYEKELLTIARSLDPAVFEHLFEAMQKAITRRILGETLTTLGSDGGKGTQALGDVHSKTLDTKSVRTSNTLAGILNRQLVRPLVLWNYGPAAPMPKLGFDTEEETDITAELAKDQSVQRMGVPLPLAYLQKKYNIPALQAGEEAAAPNVNAATPAITEDETQRFSEADAGVKGELAELRKLEMQLRLDSLGLMKERIGEVAGALRPGGSR
jgi:phage gp29-like protein